MTENEIANKIVGSALKVHRVLSAGLLESAYKECLAFKLHNVFHEVHNEYFFCDHCVYIVIIVVK